MIGCSRLVGLLCSAVAGALALPAVASADVMLSFNSDTLVVQGDGDSPELYAMLGTSLGHNWDPVGAPENKKPR